MFSMPRLPPLLRLPPLYTPLLRNNRVHQWPRPFTSSCASPAKNLPPRRVIHDSEIEENFLKGSGPGGQKINKTSSAVQLKHLATGIVVKYQDTRSRSLNRKNARKILGEKLEELEMGEDSRVRVRARERSKKKASATKKKRRKYKGVEAGKAAEGDEDEDEDIEGQGVEESAVKVPAADEAGDFAQQASAQSGAKAG